MLMGVAATTGTILGAAPANGASFSGSFSTANDIYSVSFSSDGNSTIKFKSYGYDGGTNAAGTIIAAGGFDPILTLFDPADNCPQLKPLPRSYYSRNPSGISFCR